MCCTIEQAIVGGVKPQPKKDFVKCEVMFMHSQPNTTPNHNTNKKMEIQQDINATHSLLLPHVAIFNLY
jgi:hypothetical protein